MSKAYESKQQSSLATNASNFKSEAESETSNSSGDSDIQSAVDIKIEKLEERQRRIFAQIQIPYSLEQVWQVLTDYEKFVEFMPGLIQVRRLDHPTGGVRIEQVRGKNFMGRNFSARSVFDIEEKFPHQIHYQLIEGDMKVFSGYWKLEPCSLSESKPGIELIYNFLVSPKRIFPMALVENILSHDIPANMLVIRQRAEEIFGSQ